MDNTSKIKPLLAIIAVNFAWGFDFIAIEYLMNYMPAQVLTMTRTMIGAAVMLVWCLVSKGGLKIKREDWPRVFFSGAVGFSIYFSIESMGTGMTSASFSSLIMATVPIFGMIGDRLFYGNRITVTKVICVIASIAGVYLLVSGEPMGINFKGTALMLVAALLWALYIIIVKPLYDKYDLPTLLAGMFSSGAIVSIPIAVFTTQPGTINLNITCIAIIIATSVVCIIIGEFGYIYSIGMLSVTMVSIFENVLPVTAVVFSLIIFGNMLSGIQIAGGLIIMLSVTVMAIWGEKK
ncbi:MAG: DMT family transporter [Firmicutes bacterium]|nr:DMT family transporter [Bacillota bacterium]